ncbi:MAG: diacylglycerol/lipid kinase family protein [Gemmataceae bacterium]
MSAVRACVIFNPASGRGRAKRGIKAHRKRSGIDHELRPTGGPGEAEEIALEAVGDGFTTLIAAGGDGTVHEVANGILRAGIPEVVFGVWPFGSANDYAYALGLTGDPDQPRVVKSLDVGMIDSGTGRQRYFVNGMGIGFNANVTVEARKINWLRGMPLYGLAILRAMIWRFQKPNMKIQFDDTVRTTPTLGLTVDLGKREGGFPLTPNADLSDGLFDTMHAGPVSRWDLLRHLPNMAAGTLPDNHPRMWVGRCRRVTAQSEAPLRIHLDGEFFCHPEDGFTSVAVDLLPGRLRVETGAPASR